MLEFKTESAEHSALEEGGVEGGGKVNHLFNGGDSVVEDPVVDL